MRTLKLALAALLISANVALPLASAQTSSAQAATKPAACTLTPAETEGPYYSAGAPAKANLAADVKTGTTLTVSGQVLNAACQPLKNATVEVWQADASGQYDNQGYTLRGKVSTDASGKYSFTTVVPGQYPGRTPHIHVKVTPAGGKTLTTQLYFPGNASNARDRIYQKQMELQNYRVSGNRASGTFTFVIAP